MRAIEVNHLAQAFVFALCLNQTQAGPAHSTAVTNQYVLKVAADRPESLYHLGETATFRVELQHAKAPVDGAEVHWVLSRDGVPPIQNGHGRLIAGQTSIAGKLDQPGFLQCVVTFRTPENANLTAAGGAGFDPCSIKPSLPAPDDFDDFWQKQKRKLAAVTWKPRLTPVAPPRGEVECFDLQVECAGAPVSGYFARPASATPGSLPAILTVHGAGVRTASLTDAVTWAEEGMLALDINAHGLPNGKPTSFYAELNNGRLKEYRTERRESRDTIYFLGMFQRLVRAIDFLTSRPEWDGRTVIVHGNSQGGAQSIVAAGLDPRVTFFAAGIPAMCDHTGFVVGRINGWPKFVPTGDEQPDPKVINAIRYYDAVNFAARAKAAGIITVGFIDTTCPPTGVYAAYNALPGEKEIFNDPLGVHKVSAEGQAAMRQAILHHVAAMKALRAKK